MIICNEIIASKHVYEGMDWWLFYPISPVDSSDKHQPPPKP